MNGRSLITALAVCVAGMPGMAGAGPEKGVPARSVPTPMKAAPATSAPAKTTPVDVALVKVTRSEQEWRQRLTREQFHVLRQRGTETAFTGKYWNHHAAGKYLCAACGLELFSSATKFESGTGWPSYWAPILKGHVALRADDTYGMQIDEVTCARCGGHLGHVFDDGPKPTGLRYCINSAALEFVPKK